MASSEGPRDTVMTIPITGGSVALAGYSVSGGCRVVVIVNEEDAKDALVDFDILGWVRLHPGRTVNIHMGRDIK